MQNTIASAARAVMERCDLLASFSEESDCLTRRFCTPPMHQTHDILSSWLRDIGMTVEIDAMGNLIGRYEGHFPRRSKDHPRRQTLLLGSHLDIVRHAGKYDGLLGVMVALA